MIPVAFGFVWLGYSYGLYGYCLVKGYDVTLRQLMNPLTLYTQWPPPPLAPSQIFPNGQSATGGAPAALA